MSISSWYVRVVMASKKSLINIDESGHHEALAHTWRRDALSILSETNSPMSLADLAREIAKREQERPGVTQDEELPEQIYISLYHAHIPKLEDIGLIEFNVDDRTVASA